MYRINFYNFGTSKTADTREEAFRIAFRACFEATITYGGLLIATFSPITGFTLNHE